MIQVVDASAVAAALTERNRLGAWCETRMAEGEIVAPHLMPFEVANVARRHLLAGLIEPSDAGRALDELRDLPLTLVPFDAFADRVWELRENLTAYDASYVAVAEQLDARLITIDPRLAAAPGLRCEILVAPDDR